MPLRLPLLLTICCCLFSPTLSTGSRAYFPSSYDADEWTGDDASLLFNRWTAKFNKSYATLPERNKRFGIFQSNLDIARSLTEASLRAGTALGQEMTEVAARFGPTKFMDLSPDEFRKYYLMDHSILAGQNLPVMAPSNIKENKPMANCVNGDQFDWNFCHVVTGVYNQGQCGSCWAFSVTEQLESMWAIAGNGLDHLAMQQIVDCDKTCDGCGGGLTSRAWEYLISAGGEDSLQSYPYTAENGRCDFQPGNVEAKPSSWQWVTQNEDEQAMYNYLTTTGPMSVCVDASKWQYYEGGVVLSGTCGRQLDHCVQLTGIDKHAHNSQYQAWDVRNSWGGDWGVGGYLWIQTGDNVCGIASTVTTYRLQNVGTLVKLPNACRQPTKPNCKKPNPPCPFTEVKPTPGQLSQPVHFACTNPLTMDTSVLESAEVTIKQASGAGWTGMVSIQLGASGHDLKLQVAEQRKTALDTIRLIYSGRLIEDEPTLQSQGLPAGKCSMMLITGPSNQEKMDNLDNVVEAKAITSGLVSAAEDLATAIDDGTFEYAPYTLDIVNQFGEKVELLSRDKKGLGVGMSLYE